MRADAAAADDDAAEAEAEAAAEGAPAAAMQVVAWPSVTISALNEPNNAQTHLTIDSYANSVVQRSGVKEETVQTC